MVEAIGPGIEDIDEAALDIPVVEATEQQAPDPIRKANFWYDSELARLDGELIECHKQEGKSQAEQTAMTERIGQIGAEKTALRRVDCPDLNPKEQELVEAHDELEGLASQVSQTWQLLEQHKHDEFIASQHKNDLIRLNERMNDQTDQIRVLELDLKREQR